MKKIIAAVLTVLSLSTAVFAADYSITQQDFNRVADEISINYSGHTDEYMTIFVYDVTDIVDANEETPWDGVENTPIIGLDQAVGNGSFGIKVKPDFTGDVVIVLGGEYGNSTKILLHIENGIPQKITDAEYDAGGDTAVVGDDMKITIQQGNKLLNATISTTGTGKVEYMNDTAATVTLTGDIFFNEVGEIDAVSEKTVEIRSNNDDSTYNVGYINKAMIGADDTSYIIVLTGSNGKSATSTFDVSCLEGEIRVRAGVENVPEGETITQTVTIEK
ncbi:MAG: hypothetical protein E7415_04050 [Ruminococcaceae bacterium]|nr:hypothetical protein [Oscillospiraceae bacterium]